MSSEEDVLMTERADSHSFERKVVRIQLTLDPTRVVEEYGLREDVVWTVRQVEGRPVEAELARNSGCRSTSYAINKHRKDVVDIVE